MDESEKRRRYYSPRRQEQAEATRRRMLEAARLLFAEQGYAATTLSAIAREAGVSVPTLTAVFGTKPALLDALIKWTVRGDQAPSPIETRSWWQEMLNEPDPVRQLRLLAGISSRIQGRSTDLAEIVRGAATAEPEIAALRREMSASRLQDVRGVAESLARKGALRPGLTVDRATDLLWTLGSADVYRMMVVERGWTPEEYEDWLAAALEDALLPPH